MDTMVALLNESGQWLVSQLGRMSIELTILAGIVLVTLYILRVKSPALRHLFWGLLLAKPVVTFLVASPLSLYAVLWPPLPEVFVTPTPITVQMEAPSLAAPMPATPLPDASTSPKAVSQKIPPFWKQLDRYGLVSAIWAIIVSVLGLRLLLGCAYVAFLRSTAKTQRDGTLADLVSESRGTLRMRRRVGIATTQVAHGPVLAGILRPLILLPETMAAALTEKQLRLVITHELAHARRWDNLILLIQRLAEMFFFFHPVVWFCGWMMRREAEAACDDVVVSAYGEADGTGAAAYADSLTRVAEMKCGITRRLLVNTFAAAESNFHRRIRRILNGRRTRMTLWLSLTTGASLVLIGVLGLPTVTSAPSLEPSQYAAASFSELKSFYAKQVPVFSPEIRKYREESPAFQAWREAMKATMPIVVCGEKARRQLVQIYAEGKQDPKSLGPEFRVDPRDGDVIGHPLINQVARAVFQTTLEEALKVLTPGSEPAIELTRDMQTIRDATQIENPEHYKNPYEKDSFAAISLDRAMGEAMMQLAMRSGKVYLPLPAPLEEELRTTNALYEVMKKKASQTKQEHNLPERIDPVDALLDHMFAAKTETVLKEDSSPSAVPEAKPIQSPSEAANKSQEQVAAQAPRLQIQGIAVHLNVQGEFSLTEDIWKEGKAPGKKNRDALTFFTDADALLGNQHLIAKGNEWNLDGTPIAIDHQEAPTDPPSKIQFFGAHPVGLAEHGAGLGMTSPIEAFVPKSDGGHESQFWAQNLGIDFEREAGAAGASIVDMRITVDHIEKRKASPEIPLDMGEPIFEKRNYAFRMCIQPGKDYGVKIDTGTNDAWFLRVRVDSRTTETSTAPSAQTPASARSTQSRPKLSDAIKTSLDKEPITATKNAPYELLDLLAMASHTSFVVQEMPAISAINVTDAKPVQVMAEVAEKSGGKTCFIVRPYGILVSTPEKALTFSGASIPAGILYAPPQNATESQRPPLPDSIEMALNREPITINSNDGKPTRLSQVVETLGMASDLSFVLEQDIEIPGYRFNEMRGKSILLAISDMTGGQYCAVFRDYGVLIASRQTALTLSGPTIPSDVPYQHSNVPTTNSGSVDKDLMQALEKKPIEAQFNTISDSLSIFETASGMKFKQDTMVSLPVRLNQFWGGSGSKPVPIPPTAENLGSPWFFIKNAKVPTIIQAISEATGGMVCFVQNIKSGFTATDPAHAVAASRPTLPATIPMPKLSTSPAKSNVAITLPGGVNVELVGVRKREAEDKSFWQPDGTPIAEPLYDHVESNVAAQGTPYEYVLRVNGLNKDVMLNFTTDRSAGFGNTPISKDGSLLMEFMVEVKFLTGNASVDTMEMDYAAGDWKTVLTHDPEHGPTAAYSGEGYFVAFAEPYEKERETILTITLNGDIIKDALRMIAVDKSGGLHKENGGGLSNANVKQSMYHFQGVKPEDIREYRLESCPFRKIRITDISLVPGQHTDCKITVSAPGKAIEGGYTHLVTFEPAGDFHPKTPEELLDVFNAVCKVKTGNFRTKPQDGKLVGRICTDAPKELKKAMESEPRLKWLETVELTPELFKQHSATKQQSLPGPSNITFKAGNPDIHQESPAPDAAIVLAQNPAPETDTAPEYCAEMKLMADPRESVDAFCAGLRVGREIEHGAEAERIFSTDDAQGIKKVYAATNINASMELVSAPRVTFKSADGKPEDKNSPGSYPLKMVVKANGILEGAGKDEVMSRPQEDFLGDYSASLLDFLRNDKPTALIMDYRDYLPKHGDGGKSETIPTGVTMSVRLNKTDVPNEFGLNFYFNDKEVIQPSRGLVFWKPQPPPEIFESPVVLHMTPPHSYRLGDWVVVVTKNRDPKKATLAVLNIQQVPHGTRFVEEPRKIVPSGTNTQQTPPGTDHQPKQTPAA